MSAILQIRRGTSFGILTPSEPFFLTPDYTLNIGTDGIGGYITLVNLNVTNAGNIVLTGDVTATNGIFTNDVTLQGNLYVGGDITLGNAGSDTIIVGAPFSGSLLPNITSTYDLGSSALRWDTLYVNNIDATNISGSVSVSFPDILNIPSGLVSGSIQVDHNTTTNYTASRHIDHNTLYIYPGDGLIMIGGTLPLNASRTLTLDTGSTHFIEGVTNIALTSGSFEEKASGTHTLVSGSIQINYPEISNIPDGIISGSSQLDGTTINNLSGSFYGIFYGDGSNLTGIGGGSGSASFEKTINQVSHGFNVTNLIKLSGSVWVKSQADSTSNAGTLGIVSDVIDSDNFTYVFGGLLVTGSWTSGTSYFLSPSVAGDIVTEPSYAIGEVREFIGTGTPDGLLIEIDIGDEITETGITSLPPGVISGSSQLDGTTIIGLSGSFSGSFFGDGSGLTGLPASTDITQLNQFTSSIQTEVDGLSAVTSSFVPYIGAITGVNLNSQPLDTTGRINNTHIGSVNDSGSDSIIIGNPTSNNTDDLLISIGSGSSPNNTHTRATFLGAYSNQNTASVHPYVEDTTLRQVFDYTDIYTPGTIRVTSTAAFVSTQYYEPAITGSAVLLYLSGSNAGSYLPPEWNNGLMLEGWYTFKIANSTDLYLLDHNNSYVTASITGTGTALNMTLGPQFLGPFDNVTGLGYGAEPTKNNQIVLGNADVVEVVMGNGDIIYPLTEAFSSSFEPIASGTHTLVSGSIQINYPEISNIPPGIISSSDQITSSLDLLYEEIASGTHTLVSGSDQISGSFVNITGDIMTGDLIISSSLSVSGSGFFGGDVIVQGKLTAQEFHTELVSSSIIYQSGSTKFGDTMDDTHEFTGSVYVSGSVTAYSVSSSYIDLDLLTNGNAPPHREGRLWYDQEQQSLSLYNFNTDVTHNLGFEFFTRGYNNTGATILNGTPVYISGSQGDNPYIWPAVADIIGGIHDNRNHIIGVVTSDILPNEIGFVTTHGRVNGVDTTKFSAGDELYVSSSVGELTNVLPLHPYEKIQVGRVIRSHTNGIIGIDTREPIHMDDISGISGSSIPNNKDLWVYDASNSAWYNTHSDLELSGSFNGIFYGDGTNLTGVTYTPPAGVISGSSQLDGTTINNLSGSFSGSFQGDGSGLTGVISNSSLQDVLDVNGLASTPDGNSIVNIDLIDSSSVMQFLLDGNDGAVTSFVLTPDVWSISATASGSQQGAISVNATDGIQLQYQSGSNLTIFDISNVGSGSSTIFLNPPTYITGSNFYVPLSVNEVFADTEGRIYLSVISGSSQLDGTTINNLNLTNVSASGSFSGSFFGDGSGITGVTATLPPGVISGSSQLDGTVINNLNLTNVSASGSFSGSFFGDGSGLTGITSIVPSGTVSGSDQVTGSLNLLYEEIASGTHTLVSGSSQLTGSYDLRYLLSGSVQPLPDGVVSGSSQINYTEISNIPDGIVSGSSQISDITGSLLVTASASTNVITFTKGDSSTFNLTIDTGSNYVLPNGVVSGSSQLTGSYDLRYTLSGSISPLPPGVVSGSDQVTGSLNLLYEEIASGTHTLVSGSSQINFPDISNIPSGLVSSSDQISGSYVQSILTGEPSGSDKVVNMVSLTQAEYDAGIPNATTFYIITDALDSSLLYEEIASGTHTLVSGSIQINYPDISNIPSGIVSSSDQVTSSLDLRYTLSGSISPLPSGVVSGSSQLTSSYDTRYETQGRGIISGSSQITSSLNLLYEEIASGTHTLVSGSSQLTGSYDLRYTLSGSIQPLPDGVVSGSIQINYPEISNIPDGIVSSSDQVTSSLDLRYTLSGSVQPLPDGVVSGSQQISAFGFISESVPQLLSYTASAGELSITDGNTINLGWEFTDTVDGFIFGSPDDKLTVLGNIEIEESAISGAVYTFPDRSGTLALLDDFTTYSGSFSGSIDYNNITNLPTLVSGSSQINYPDISNIPSGIVSSSDQVTSSLDLLYEEIASGTHTLVSGSSQLTGSYDLRYVISGSVQPLPDGVVSGSSQLTSSYDTRYELQGNGIVSSSIQISDITGSLLVTASASTNVITFTKGDSSTFNLTIDTGSNYVLPSGVVSGSDQVTSSLDLLYEEIASGTHTLVSGSSQLDGTTINNLLLTNVIASGSFSGSFQGDGSLLTGLPPSTDITSLNQFTSSIQTEVDGLSAQTSSYLTSLPDGLVSGSSQLTGSYDLRYELQGRGIISGSSQLDGTVINNLNLTNVSASGSFSGSFYGDGSNLTGVTSYTDADTLNFINSIGVVSGSIEYQSNLDVDPVSEVVASIPTSSYDGVFFDYVIKSGSNARAGMVMATYINQSVTYTDNSTLDIGDTSPVTMSVDILSGNIRLIGTTSTNNWIIKTLIRKI